jgi:hypothetical protein
MNLDVAKSLALELVCSLKSVARSLALQLTLSHSSGASTTINTLENNAATNWRVLESFSIEGFIRVF